MREAACLGTTEIFLRVAEFNKDAFKTHSAKFAESLLVKLRDPYWGVRVQACQALSHLIKAYREELTEAFIATSTALLVSKLSDNAASVRESAAISLVNIATITNLENVIKAYLKDNLLKAKEQKPEV